MSTSSELPTNLLFFYALPDTGHLPFFESHAYLDDSPRTTTSQLQIPPLIHTNESNPQNIQNNALKGAARQYPTWMYGFVMEAKRENLRPVSLLVEYGHMQFEYVFSILVK
jgi:hypothetical protein